MSGEAQQAPLFPFPDDLPQGLLYQPDFLSRDEEAILLSAIAPLPLREAKFREYFAKRRVAHFHAEADAAAVRGWGRDSFGSGTLPGFIVTLRDKVADWVGVAAASLVHALVSEYRPGTPIGWHRDKPDYGIVIGISLAGWGRMRFRPLATPDARHTVTLDLAPRSGLRDARRHSLAMAA